MQISSANMIMPRSGIITDFAAQLYSHTNTTGQPNIDMTIVVSLYISKDGGITYRPALPTPIDFTPNISPSTIVLTLFEATPAPGSIINISVDKGDRIMFVMAARVNSSIGNGTMITQSANFSIAVS